ncbi:MAG TPA: potassium-transporting ATPase subunit KdpC [Clostridia bacterium]|nr:potassium-transporting ATPase subunit KdpC [Clostridia bacterium]
MKELKRALIAFGILVVITGIIYPLAVTGIAQLTMFHRANGSLVSVSGHVVGSELIGQQWTSSKYFHGRPSAVQYDASGSGGTNLGPSSADLEKTVIERVAKVRSENGLAADATVPADLVTASASGLDPDISPESALLQVRRVAAARGLAPSAVEHLVTVNTRKPFLGIWGQSRVNVLELNIALDKLSETH